MLLPPGATVIHLQLMNFGNITECHTFCLRLQNQARQTGCLWDAQGMVLICM